MSSCLPGPREAILVHGRPTTLHHMSSSEFIESPYFEALMPMINASFAETQQPYLSASLLRFGHPSAFKGELAGIERDSRPFSTVIFLTFTDVRPSDPHPLGLIGTVTCRLSPWHDSAKVFAKSSETDRKFNRPASVCKGLPGTVDWELKLLVTGMGYKRQGVAACLEKAFDDEIRRRTTKAIQVLKGIEREDWDTEYVINSQVRSDLMQANGDVKDPKIRILLSTMKEVMARYYEKRGYATDAEVPCPVGTLGGTVPFSLSHMSKIL